jgi:hypothetical protein
MNRTIILIFVALFGLFFSIFAGVNIALGEYETLGVYGSTAVILYFFAHGWRNVWWFAALLIFSGVIFLHSFEFNVEHLFFLMICLASLMFIVSKGAMPRPRELEIAGARTVRAFVVLLLVYGLFHFLGNYGAPYSPSDYSLKSASKAYFDCFATMTAFFWLLTGPYGFYLKPHWPRTLILIIFAALVGNVTIRANMFLQGFQAADGMSSSDVDFFSFHVPVINMFAGIYTLRHMTPIALVILLMIATSAGWWRNNPRWLKLVVMASIGLCLVGAILSGGRATLLFCFLMMFLVALVRRQIGLIALGCMAATLAVIVINMFAGLINTKAPAYIARSLQLVMLEKGDAYRSIEGSQETRAAGRKAAIVEWRKDNRVFFFGRSVYRITWDDATYINQKYGLDGFVMNAMRSGRTHNLITDLLIQYGLVGCILYLTAYIVVISYYFRLWKSMPKSEPVLGSLVGAVAIYLPVVFIYQIFGANYMPSIAVLVLGIARSHLATLRAPVIAPAPAAPVAGRFGTAATRTRNRRGTGQVPALPGS